MKLAVRSLMLVSIVTTFAYTQTLPHFQHIVIIVQENRTPDNLFGSGPVGSMCGHPDPFEPGVDIQDGGPAEGKGTICDSQIHLLTGFDPNHSYENGWLVQWHNGAMDGACNTTVFNPNNVILPYCPQYSYVIRSEVQPYFDIATNYGFANYMFETNEGPSFPAHQFILSGTSAPVPPGNSGYNYFDAENPVNFNDSGCPFPKYTPSWVDPLGNETTQSVDCYTHNTLVNQLDPNHITWRYYTPTEGVIWDAPAAISGICGQVVNGNCTGPDFANVIWPGKGNTPLIPAIPSLQDVDVCNMQQVSWVIPDTLWSDHPASGGLGPSYVANLVDAIGNSTCKDANGQTSWQDTAIFITWDDWGGWFDHVPPPAFYRGEIVNNQPVCLTANAPNGWGCGYVYGFRVPLLVVSAYTPAGYVSGAISGTTTYPPPKEYTHDFGSILAFFENNFGLKNIAYPDLYYADYNAVDWVLPNRNNIPLSDFFPGPYRGFSSISPTNPEYNANYFLNYYTNNNATPQGPDGDDSD